MEYDFLKAKKIMLVDDEPALITLVISILKDNGFFNLITASSVKEAYSLLDNQTPDLYILDVMLADGNGFALMENIRAKSDAPIIFLTAKDQAEDKFTGLDRKSVV